MTDIERSVHDALLAIYPKLQQNPAELHARLARRRTKTYLRPPRCACLALRADDTRLDNEVPALRVDNRDWSAQQTRAYRRKALLDGTASPTQTLTVTAALVERLTKPITLYAARSIPEQAALLGVSPTTIARLSSTTTPLPPDADGAPLRKTNYRFPPAIAFKTVDGRGEVGIAPFDKRAVEHARAMGWKDLDGPEAMHYARGKRYVVVVPWPHRNRLFDPSAHRIAPSSAPATVWPHFADLWPTLIHQLPEDFEQPLTRKRQYQPPNSHQRRPLDKGYVWCCPQCGNDAKLLYLPTRLPAIPDDLELTPEQSEQHDRLSPPDAFACKTCHNVSFYTPGSTAEAWNHLVSHLSASLLYGHEVPKPPWVQTTQQTREKKGARPNRQRPRINEIIQRRSNGQSWAEIGAALNIKPASAHRLWYRDHPPGQSPAPTPLAPRVS